VVAALVALVVAVFAKSEAIPNALTRLNKAARHVMRDRRRRPESRAAPLLRCLMRLSPSGPGLRAHQEWLRSR